MSIWEELGVRRVINAAGTYTSLGGSRMSAQTLSDMAEIASSFVEIEELQRAVHQKLAQMTHNEAAYVCNGAACGVYLCLAAAVAKKYKKPFRFVTREEIAASEVVVFCSHRNPYDWVLTQLGVKIVEIGYANQILPSGGDTLRYAIGERTVAVYYLQAGWAAQGALELEEVLKVTRPLDIPVIVDAAAQLPPAENLWRYTRLGATAAVFSGGKDPHGPQSSGLIVGAQSLLAYIEDFAFPHHGYGRMMKVGREEIVGLYSAIKQYLAIDESQRLAACEAQIAALAEQLSASRLFRVERSYPNEAGQPIPRAFVALPEGRDPASLQQWLWNSPDAIYTTNEGRNGIYLNPMSLTMAEMQRIGQRLLEYEEQER